MADAISGQVRTATTWSLVLSVLMIGAGVLAIGLPLVAGIAVGALVAWLLLFSGVLHLAFAWRSHTARAVVWEILLGIVYGAIGIYLLAHPLLELAGLTLAVAIYLCAEAILEFVLWFQLRPAAGRGWLLFDAIVTLVLALMIGNTWPSSATWVIGTLVGISMLFNGMSRLVLTLAVRRIVAHG
jgi:uncharacterized membrane protein HdeD (DUF308 family)